MTMHSGMYIAKADLDAPHLAGVAQKIHAQSRVFSRTLGDVSMLHTSARGVVCDQQLIKPIHGGRVAHRLQHLVQFHDAVVDFAKAHEPDYCYIRYQRSGPGFIKMLQRLRRFRPGMPIFVEIPTYPYATESAHAREIMLNKIDRFFRLQMAPFVDRIVTFSVRSEILGIETIQTDNGIDLDTMPIIAPARTPPVRLLGLANLSFWHGYDRVIEGLARRPDLNVIFDVVGTGNELAKLRADTARLGLEDRVIFHGSLSGTALTRVLAGAHIGIASIGMHRVSVETSTLKTREYCSRGLPFVMAYSEADFGPDLPFVFNAPATDEPLDIAAVVNFRQQLSDHFPDFPTTMRTYAEQALTWDVKLAPVVSAFRTMIEDGRT